MNLYSNKQKWKIILLIFALLLVGASLYVSNQIVNKVGEREKERATQWADAVRKKVELVKLTNNTFTQLREKEREKMSLWIDATKEVSRAGNLNEFYNYDFPLKIISDNNDIPVIVLDNEGNVSGFRNLSLDTSTLRKSMPELSKRELLRAFDDSLTQLAKSWEQKNEAFTIEVYEDLFLTYYYTDSKQITKLESERDSLINSFNNDLVNNDGLVPVLLLDSKSDSIIGTNLKSFNRGGEALIHEIDELKKVNAPIRISFRDGESIELYYGNSPELRQLQYFPYIQFLLIGLFIFIGYLIFSTFRKAEQNQVWAGMAKETAHQLGTPLSSLMAWIQFLETQEVEASILGEMQKDIDRLSRVTERFSKIGSGAKLEELSIYDTVSETISYLRPRISDQVILTVGNFDQRLLIPHNRPLMEWVVENICKNAVDAMEGKGNLDIVFSQDDRFVHIDISDTGKGLSSKQFKTVFQPGYSTKQRGWGLGLSLVRRIIHEYHHGKVFVLNSAIGVGTTFRISLPK